MTCIVKLYNLWHDLILLIALDWIDWGIININKDFLKEFKIYYMNSTFVKFYFFYIKNQLMLTHENLV